MFTNSFQTIITQVVVLYTVVAVGFAACKAGVFSRKTARGTIDLVFNVVLPVAIIRTFAVMEKTPARVKGIFIAFACSVAVHLLGVLIASLLFKKRTLLQRGLYKYGIVFSNAAFLALPLAQSLLGDEGVFYCSVYVAVFNVFTFTYGRFEISGRATKIDLKKMVLNPGSLSVIIGVALFLLEIKLPQIMLEPMQLVGSMNAPLAMIIFGTFLASTPFKGIFAHKELYVIAAVKLLVLPLVLLASFKLFGISGVLPTALIISTAAPSASNTAMFAEKFGNDSSLACQMVALSTLFSLLTMPAIVALAAML